jgi:uncharacterized membrane-anchored protein YjiN (DUF445 family)
LNPEFARALLTILFGALAGGVTNTVAVWMLFHPYRPVRIAGLRVPFLHGAIPKNQDRLAAAVGRTVGDRLLTEEDLGHILGSPEFRAAFDERLGAFLDQLLEQERGPLRELLPDELTEELDRLLEEAVDHLATRLEKWIETDQFEESVERRIQGFLGRMSDEPVADILTPAREAALAAAVEEWAAEAVEREAFEGAVEDYLARTFRSFLQEDRTFEEVLPAGLVGSLERALSGYLPLAVRKLGGVLDDPEARAQLEAAVKGLFQRFLQDLRFHQRVVAKLVVTEDTLQRVLATLETEGAERLSEMLRDPAVQDAMARKVNDAVLDFLARPVTSVFGQPDDENVLKARETATGWILGMVRDPETRGFLVEKLRQGIGKASGGTWGELLEHIPPERVAAGVASAARSDAARSAYREALRRILLGVLDRPVGRPAAWLPRGAAGRLRGALSDPLWSWIQGQVPLVVQTLDVGRRVEEKVREFPTRKMEELVRRVTDRELRLIVRLGYALGAVIGGVLVVLNAVLG